MISASTVLQFAFCLVSCLKILESANTAVGTIDVNIPVTNTIFKKSNNINEHLIQQNSDVSYHIFIYSRFTIVSIFFARTNLIHHLLLSFRGPLP